MSGTYSDRPAPRLVTIALTIRTRADDDRLTAAILNALETPLEEWDTELVPCDWAPDPDTIADCVDPLDPYEEPDLHRVEVLDLNPLRRDPGSHWTCQGCDASGSGVAPAMCPTCLSTEVCTFDPA